MKIVSIIAAPPGWRTAHYDDAAKEVFYSVVGAWGLVETRVRGETVQEVSPLIAMPDSGLLELIADSEAPAPILVPPGHTATWGEGGFTIREAVT